MESSNGAAENRKSFYRADVDGLRALAIIPVVLFHTKLGFPGGFVGVDIFFVISGFLISSLILKDLEGGKFSLVSFWERRVRRILPASAVVVAATLAAGWFWLFSEDYAALGRSVVAQTAMMSNFYFFRHTDYFAPSSDTVPMLHTWSLAVEEQFYMIFPLMLAAAFRFGRKSVVGMVALVSAGSLALSVVGTAAFPTATFFLLPARAWELLLGTMLAVFPGHSPKSSSVREVLGWLGLVLIAGSVAFYDEHTPFPGWAALPPCLGAAFIIASSGAGLSTVGRILSARPLVFVGLISYSLYLWHWPVLVFSKALSRTFEGPGILEKVGLITLMVALAILSWRFVERPFRQKDLFVKRWQIFAFALVSSALLMGFGALINAKQGFRSRLPERVLRLENSRNNIGIRSELKLEAARAGKLVELGGGLTNQAPFLLLWGDSHAMAIGSVMDELCRVHARRGVMATHSQTPPALGYVANGYFALKSDTPAWSEAVFEYVASQKVAHVVMTAVWNAHAPVSGFKSNLVFTVKRLRELGVRVHVMKDVPIPGFDVPHIVAMTAFQGRDVAQLGVSVEKHLEAEREMESTFDEIRKLGGEVLDPAPCFLDPAGFYSVVLNDMVLYWDGGHLTPDGARLLTPIFEPIFRVAAPM